MSRGVCVIHTGDAGQRGAADIHRKVAIAVSCDGCGCAGDTFERDGSAADRKTRGGYAGDGAGSRDSFCAASPASAERSDGGTDQPEGERFFSNVHIETPVV